MTDEYDWSWNANTLYVYAPSHPGSRYAAVEVPQRNSVIRLPEAPYEDYVEYVAFDNLELMYAMRHGLYPGYNEIEAHGLRVTNCFTMVFTPQALIFPQCQGESIRSPISP
jgi:hypothetical protein